MAHASNAGEDGPLPWGAINVRHPMPSFALPSLQSGLREHVSRDKMNDLCSRFKPHFAHFEQQRYREAIMVPVFVSQKQSILDEDKVRSHIDAGRKVIAPKDEMADVMSQEALGNGSGIDLGASAPRRLGGALCKRREVTGKIGALPGAVPVLAEISELWPSSSAEVHRVDCALLSGGHSKDRQSANIGEVPKASVGGWGTPRHDLDVRAGNRLDGRMQTPWRWSDDGSQATTPLAKTLEEAQLWGAAQVEKEPHGAIPVLTTALKLGVGFSGARGSRPHRGGLVGVTSPRSGIRHPKALARKGFPIKKACSASLPTDPIVRSARDKASACVKEVAPAAPSMQSARDFAPPACNTLSRRWEKP